MGFALKEVKSATNGKIKGWKKNKYYLELVEGSLSKRNSIADVVTYQKRKL